MKNLFTLTMASVLAIALTAGSIDMSAQVRRSGTTTSSSSTASSSSSSETKQSTTATTPSRSSQVNRGNTSTTSSSTSTGSATRTTQVNRGSSSSSSTTSSGSNAGSTTQVRRGSSTSTGSSSTGSRATRATQVNRGNSSSSSTTSTSGSSSSQRQASTTTRKSGTTTSTSSSSSATPSRSTATSRTSTGTTSTSQTAARSDQVTRRNVSVTTKGLGSAAESSSASSNASQANGIVRVASNVPEQQVSHMTMDADRNMMRIPPRNRGNLMFDVPVHFYDRGHHYFGYRIESLPPSRKHITYWGRDYYHYNDIYYRRFGTVYVVSRPPFGVTFSVNLRQMSFASVRFAYYHNVYYAVSVTDKNFKTILKQNQQIAKNNAILAKQNAALALNSSRALSAYELADALGLVQSYAGMNTNYFYDDGVFYIINSKGYYEVIVPPAGALVDQLPDDYDIIVLNGIEYYKVDDTVYRLVLEDGSPYLEVLGQMVPSISDTYYNW